MYRNKLIPNIEITVESTGKTYDLLDLITETANERFGGDKFHPGLDELWNLFEYAN